MDHMIVITKFARHYSNVFLLHLGTSFYENEQMPTRSMTGGREEPTLRCCASKEDATKTMSDASADATTVVRLFFFLEPRYHGHEQLPIYSLGVTKSDLPCLATAYWPYVRAPDQVTTSRWPWPRCNYANCWVDLVGHVHNIVESATSS